MDFSTAQQGVTTFIGYGSSTVTMFDGIASNFENFESEFISAMRLTGLHLALEKYAHRRPAEGFDLEAAKETIYDWLCISIDRVSKGLIRREAPDDGVKALEILRKYYMRDTQQRLHKLWRSFITSKMQDDEEVNLFMCKIDDIVSKLVEAEEKISDSLKVVTLLNALSSKYSNFIEIALQRNPPYTYEALKIALLEHEDRLMRKENTSVSKMVSTDEST